tara:strand:- start:286 stop:558 length:273 start_codon:yes stop_codon:yes gene_type:complete
MPGTKISIEMVIGSSPIRKAIVAFFVRIQVGYAASGTSSEKVSVSVSVGPGAKSIAQLLASKFFFEAGLSYRSGSWEVGRVVGLAGIYNR